ncbi:unnamed protein product, partial [Discosporangium mesarthrocarpum]
GEATGPGPVAEDLLQQLWDKLSPGAGLRLWVFASNSATAALFQLRDLVVKAAGRGDGEIITGTVNATRTNGGQTKATGAPWVVPGGGDHDAGLSGAGKGHLILSSVLQHMVGISGGNWAARGQQVG